MIISRDLVIIASVWVKTNYYEISWNYYEISWNNHEISWNNHEISWLFYFLHGPKTSNELLYGLLLTKIVIGKYNYMYYAWYVLGFGKTNKWVSESGDPRYNHAVYRSAKIKQTLHWQDLYNACSQKVYVNCILKQCLFWENETAVYVYCWMRLRLCHVLFHICITLMDLWVCAYCEFLRYMYMYMYIMKYNE